MSTRKMNRAWGNIAYARRRFIEDITNDSKLHAYALAVAFAIVDRLEEMISVTHGEARNERIVEQIQAVGRFYADDSSRDPELYSVISEAKSAISEHLLHQCLNEALALRSYDVSVRTVPAVAGL